MKKDNGKGPRKLFPREEYSWRNMVSRCNNPKATGYSYYGGNGITFDPRWADFDLFYLDMGKRPPNTSLDRIDYSKGYYKENCRWATSIEQANNTSRNIYLDFNGTHQTLTMWARDLNIKPNTLQYRLYRGWSLERALSTTTKEERQWKSTQQLKQPKAPSSSKGNSRKKKPIT